MSRAYENRRKAKKRERTLEEKRIARLIRSGELPRWFIAKDNEGRPIFRVVRESRDGMGHFKRWVRTWPLKSTMVALKYGS